MKKGLNIMKKYIVCLLLSVFVLRSCSVIKNDYLTVYGGNEYLSATEYFSAKEIYGASAYKEPYHDDTVPRQITENAFGENIQLYYYDTIYKGRSGWLHCYESEDKDQCVQYSVGNNEIVYINDLNMCSSGYHETKLTDDDAIKIAHEYAKTRWSFVAEGNYKVIIGNHSCDFRIYFHRLNKGFITDDYVSAFLTCDGQICGWTYGFENAPRLEERESEIQNIDVEKCKQSIEHFITKKSEKLSKKDCVINSFGDPWVKVSNDGILYCYINTEVTIDGEKESLPMYVEIASGVSKGS